MQSSQNHPGGRAEPRPQVAQNAPPVESALLDVEQIAALLRCSTRHAYRLSDAGRMPRPLKLGALVRWNRTEVERWLNEGCPSCRKAGKR